MPKLPSGVSIVTESALPLIFKDGPRGQFLCLTKDQDGNAKICAVDNNTGDAWTEDFNSLTAALYWLENQAATPNEAETYAAAKAAEQYDDPLREEIDRYIESERAAVQKLADQIEHYVNTAHEGRVTVQTKHLTHYDTFRRCRQSASGPAAAGGIGIRLPTKIGVPSFSVGPPSQRLPCLRLPLEARYHSLRPPFAKRGVWNSFSISLLVR